MEIPRAAVRYLQSMGMQSAGPQGAGASITPPNGEDRKLDSIVSDEDIPRDTWMDKLMDEMENITHVFNNIMADREDNLNF